MAAGNHIGFDLGDLRLHTKSKTAATVPIETRICMGVDLPTSSHVQSFKM